MEESKNAWVWALVAVALLFLFGSFGMGFGFIFMLLLWGLIIWVIVTLINASQSNKNELNSLTTLKRRYASGEITKKQYEGMKKEIGV